MTRFPFTVAEWQEIKKPRRWKFIAYDSHTIKNVSSVSVWEKIINNEFRSVDVIGIRLTHLGIEVESLYKFDGEVRIAY